MFHTSASVVLIFLLASAAAQNSCNRMDLVFVVDSSGSVHNSNFQQVKKALGTVLDVFRISSSETRIGIVTFGTGVFEVVPFATGVAELKDAISQLNYQNGGTDTNEGLDRAMQMIDKDSRTDTAKVIVLITDGQSASPDLTLASAAQAKSRGIATYAIGVGEDVNFDELSVVATQPGGEYVSTISSFSQLAGNLYKVAEKMCQPTTVSVCTGQLDVLFVLDGSSSVKNINFQNAVQLLLQTVEFFMPSTSLTRMGAITYATGIFQSLPLSDDRSIITNGLKALAYPNGGTDTDQAIRAATAELLSKRKVDVPQVMVVITDGMSSNPTATIQAASDAKQNGITIYSIGIGLQDDRELRAISSDNRMFTGETYSQLSETLNNSIKAVCREVPLSPRPGATPSPFATTTSATVPGACTKAVDIMVLVDSTIAVNSNNFYMMKEYLLTFVHSFAVSPLQARFGGGCFGSTVTGGFGLLAAMNATENAIAALRYSGDVERNTDRAISYGTELLLSNRRYGAPSALVILTAGASTAVSRTISSLQITLAARINVYAISIASSQGTDELRLIQTNNLYVASSWDYLPTVLRTVGSDICN